MASDSTGIGDLIRQACDGDEDALARLFGQFRPRLRRMVQLRMDRRLQGRVDPSDVLQEAFIDLAKRLPRYSGDDQLPFFLWLRLVTGERLLATHRRHLMAEMRDAGLEVSLNRGFIPRSSSESIAAHLMGRLTSASQKAMRAELQLRLQEMLNQMDPIDREILVLRHFEDLTNNEAAHTLEISKAAASNRYVRALKRLKKFMLDQPGFIDGEGSGVES